MTPKAIDFTTVDLDNCHREPIHIPGFVQPHGLLFALDFRGRLTHATRGAHDTLADFPPLGASWPASPAGMHPGLWKAVTAALNDEETGQESTALNLEVASGDAVFDAVIHVNDDRLIVELERQAPSSTDLAALALLAHRGMDRLRNRKDIATLLREAVSTVRQLTGFDRVMAYRFHPDDSGEVVAEECQPGFESFLHRRFPASDIPPQARELYVRNPLRLIADVDDDQVPIDADDATARPLDLTYSVLRSVSPIHIEYLRNIHVQASMSLSIVVHGRLWGLIACHHGVGHRVPYAVRTTCDVLSQVLSSSVQRNVERNAATRRQGAVAVIGQMTQALRDGTLASSVVGSIDALGKVIAFDASLCALGGIHWQSDLSVESASLLLRWLDAGGDGRDGGVVAMHEASGLPEPLRWALRPFCGLLALCIDRVNHGWIVLLRREQIETIVWSGIPAKLQRIGPLGTRLTPQGSLAEWRQTVEGTAVAWSEQDLAIAHDLTEALGRAGAANAARQAMARAQMLAILGHDLRDPVHSISMMGELLQRGTARAPAEYGTRIARAVGRMKRLIGEVFEMSRMTSGLGLELALIPGDFAAFVDTLVDDARMVHPQCVVLLESPPMLMARFDPDRMAQVVSNLLSNARNHGLSGEPVRVRVADDAGRTILSVTNSATPIAEARIGSLFDAFKPESVGNVRNPGGLGLGLYIASEVAKGHGGTLEYSHDDTSVTFTMTLPLLADRQVPARAAAWNDGAQMPRP